MRSLLQQAGILEDAPLNMKQEPLVSVITVTYNSAKYVRDAIESVLNQTYSNFEYILKTRRNVSV